MSDLATKFFFLTIILFTACSRDKIEDPPNWVQSLPKSVDTLYVIGVAENRSEALISALAGISYAIEAEVTSVTTADSVNQELISYTSKSKTKFSFGNVIVVSESKNDRINDGSKILSDAFKITTKLIYDNSGKHLSSIQTLSEKGIDPEHMTTSHYFEVSEQNMGYDDIIMELNNADLHFEHYSDKDSFYTLAKYKVDPEAPISSEIGK